MVPEGLLRGVRWSRMMVSPAEDEPFVMFSLSTLYTRPADCLARVPRPKSGFIVRLTLALSSRISPTLLAPLSGSFMRALGSLRKEGENRGVRLFLSII